MSNEFNMILEKKWCSLKVKSCSGTRDMLLIFNDRFDSKAICQACKFHPQQQANIPYCL